MHMLVEQRTWSRDAFVVRHFGVLLLEKKLSDWGWKAGFGFHLVPFYGNERQNP